MRARNIVGGFIAKMKIVAIVQARVGSARLPGKMLKKIKDESLLEHVIERLKKSKCLSSIIVATSSSKENDAIKKMCDKNKIRCFRGPENNVLKRYYECALEENEIGRAHV